jgi:hypothetical protein
MSPQQQTLSWKYSKDNMMNRTVAILTFVALVALGVIGYVVLSIVKPDSKDSFVSFLLIILGQVTIAWGILWNLGRTNEKLETVRKQTNGTLSTLVERTDNQSLMLRDKETEIRVLKSLLSANGINHDEQ